MGDAAVHPSGMIPHPYDLGKFHDASAGAEGFESGRVIHDNDRSTLDEAPLRGSATARW